MPLLTRRSVTKGFATSLAIVLASLAGAILFGTRLTILFMVGTAFVLCATYMCALAARQQALIDRRSTCAHARHYSRR